MEKNEPIIIERTFDVPVTKVWKAITAKDQMRHWYFDLKDFRPEAGFKFQFTAGEGDRQYLHLCEVTEVIKEKKLTYSWRYDGYEGNSFVTFELFEQGNSTLLRLTHRGVQTFVTENPDFRKESFVAGWTHIITISLQKYLEGKK